MNFIKLTSSSEELSVGVSIPMEEYVTIGKCICYWINTENRKYNLNIVTMRWVFRQPKRRQVWTKEQRRVFLWIIIRFPQIITNPFNINSQNQTSSSDNVSLLLTFFKSRRRIICQSIDEYNLFHFQLTINDLPEEILSLIAEPLGLRDRAHLYRCNRAFQSAVANSKWAMPGDGSLSIHVAFRRSDSKEKRVDHVGFNFVKY